MEKLLKMDKKIARNFGDLLLGKDKDKDYRKT